MKEQLGFLEGDKRSQQCLRIIMKRGLEKMENRIGSDMVLLM